MNLEFFHNESVLGKGDWALTLWPCLVPNDELAPTLDFAIAEHVRGFEWDDVAACARHMDWQEPFDYVWTLETDGEP